MKIYLNNNSEEVATFTPMDSIIDSVYIFRPLMKMHVISDFEI